MEHTVIVEIFKTYPRRARAEIAACKAVRPAAVFGWVPSTMSWYAVPS